MKEQLISKEGYNKLIEELNFLSTIKRREIADRIERSKDLGDLSENAEYNEAKDAQSSNEARIFELNNILKNVTIVESNGNKKEVGMGSKLLVKTGRKEKTFKIVSFNEANPLEGKISNESPIGTAFLGKKKGDKVKVSTPRGDVSYTILKIT